LATSTTSTTITTTTAKPRIRVLGPARYLVESTSRSGLGHQVDVLPLRCGCEAGKYGWRCRHLVLAMQYDDWWRRQQALVAASSTRPAGMAVLQETF
jgi:SWIM zinc finger